MKQILLTILELCKFNIIQKTGEKAFCSGVWRSSREYIPLTKGERFPPSPTNKWYLVVNL